MSRKFCLLAAILVLPAALAFSQDPTTTPAKPAPPVTLAPWVLHAKLTYGPAPEYPESARENHVEGDAFVDVVVDENGKVQSAKWVECMNCSSVLGIAAAAAVQKWEYQPTTLDGKPIRVSSWVAVRFRFDGEPSIEVLTKSESSTPAVKPPGPPPRVATPRRIRISSGVAEGSLISKVDPEYPAMAKVAHVQGDVVIQCIINHRGEIAEARVLSGHPLFAQPALDAVKQWKYRPYLLNGEPVEVETTVTVRFHM